MNKPRLDKKRLYRIAKIGVIALTLFLILKMWLIDSKQVNYIQSNYYIELNHCDSLYTTASKRDECYAQAKKKFDDITLNPPTQTDLFLIVLIPTLFFGGARLYKYLFTVKEAVKK